MKRKIITWLMVIFTVGGAGPVDVKGNLVPQAGTGILGECKLEITSLTLEETVNGGGGFQLLGSTPVITNSKLEGIHFQNGLLHIQLDKADQVQYSLFNIQGEILVQSSVGEWDAGKYQVDPFVTLHSALSPGVYTFKIKIGKIVKKFTLSYLGEEFSIPSQLGKKSGGHISKLEGRLKRTSLQPVDTLSILCKGYNPKRIALDNYVQDLGNVVIKKTNIIHVMLDEIGYYEMSNMGHPEIKTPNVDKMAEEGMKFTQAMAGSAVCAPTRCALMTGLHMGNCAFIGNSGNQSIRDEDETIAELLKQKGYATGGYGKWGMGDIGSPGVPEKQGFDEFYGYYHQVHAHTFFPEMLVRNSVQEPQPGNIAGGNGWGDYYSGGTYSQDTLFSETKKFLTANKDKPFFLYLPYTPPHGLWGIPDDNEFWLKYKDKPWNAGQQRATDSRVYAAMIEMVDAQVGELLQMLKDYGIDENTMVIFSGDNGGQYYFHTDKVTNQRNWNRGFFGPNDDPNSPSYFRGQKRDLYEGGLRIPMVIRWPGVIPKDTVNDLLWYFPDFLTTYADIAGAVPTMPHDGISIYPTLAGEKIAGAAQTQHEYLYWEWPGDWQAIRQGKWKFHKKGNGSIELYDLDADISESNNLASTNPNIVAQFEQIALKEKR